jgi:putative inorganic carbon (HCO3(-)) transporter
MRTVFLTAILSYMLVLGFSYPFIAGLAYVWIDIVKPQDLAYFLINGWSLSLIASVVAVLSYVFARHKKSFKFTPEICLLIIFAAWMTYTSFHADPRLFSWNKWDWAFKVVIFTIFISVVFRSRVHFEALILTIIFSVATISFSSGVKTALGGGGYGVLAILGGDNSGLGESSTLAAVCVMQLPLLHYVYKHSIIFPRNRLFHFFIWMIVAITILTIVGTSARTGLVACVFLLLCYLLRSKRKLIWSLVIILAMGIFLTVDLGDTAWGSRMSTIDSYNQDSSALGRLKVWQWTLNFIAENPLGGGFDAFKLNGISKVTEEAVEYYEPGVINGKAFHNIYFEVLGEQGIIGFAIYISLLVMTLLKLQKTRVFGGDNVEFAWARDLALRLRDALLTLLVSGMFIGIAYQCYIFYLIAITISLRQLLPKVHTLANPSTDYATST